ncbi:hypothetical protein PHET_11990 [Paragonimus heterotremus]|uniref:Uncharacterized protein n=1 Tax=Paragonimus heterotremus TaxID=100268 RepID=A0A8J4WDB9_9TREM|nr:hypothetical protein PHET_11990 [Paragonimus heterotremus]
MKLVHFVNCLLLEASKLLTKYGHLTDFENLTVDLSLSVVNVVTLLRYFFSLTHISQQAFSTCLLSWVGMIIGYAK